MLEIDWQGNLNKKSIFGRGNLKTELNPLMCDWLLPPWFEKQNNPLEAAYSAGTTDFVNLTSRNWVTLYAKNARDFIMVDGYGIIHLRKIGISMEIWVHADDKIFTPGMFFDIQHKLCPICRGVGIISEYNSGILKTQFLPAAAENGTPVIQTQLSILNKSNDSLEPISILFVIRPFDNNGMAAVNAMEYKERSLFINRKKLLFFEKEPAFSFFSNAKHGDVTQYFELGEGNEKIFSVDGSCTGMLGFSGLPEELKDIKLSIAAGAIKEIRKPKRVLQLFKSKRQINENETWPERLSQDLNLLKTNTKLDNIYLSSLVHLETFSSITDEVNVYQILAYNRLNKALKSKSYLNRCFKNVRWDGSLAEHFLGPGQLVFAVLDVYQFTGDTNFIRSHWPVLERIGSWLAEVANKVTGISANAQDSFFKEFQTYEYYFWVCAGLKALGRLGMILNKTTRAQFYKEEYLSLKGMLLYCFADTVRIKKQKMAAKSENGNGGQMVRCLCSSYPLRLFNINERVIQDSIDLIMKKNIYNGAVTSPLDFKGIDLELTVKLGQVLVREGFNYNRLLNSLLKYTGPAWSWPNRANPVSKEGIGETGHDAKVLYQMLLLLRNIMVMEDDEILYLLPGIFCSGFWRQPQLTTQDIPTHFGKISLNCQFVGNIVQIDYEPHYRLKPNKACLIIPATWKVIFCDQEIQYQQPFLEIDPDFRLLRLRKD